MSEQSPFDIKTGLEKKNLSWEEVIEKDYSPFILNRAFSFNMQTILMANEMNKASFIPKKWNFDFYYAAIPKGSQYDKWIKREKTDKDILAISKFYNINNKRAVECAKILTPEQMRLIHEKLTVGGKR